MSINTECKSQNTLTDDFTSLQHRSINKLGGGLYSLNQLKEVIN
jgi:hypothetical protein